MNADLLLSLEQRTGRFNPNLLDRLRRYALDGGGFDIEVKELAPEIDLQEEAAMLLEELTPDQLVRKDPYVCPDCGQEVSQISIDSECCEFCNAAFTSENPATQVLYFERDGPPCRHVDWLLLLHGMKTLGVWQEKLSWLVARSYGRMVGVAIYKYGYIVTGVLMAFRHRQLVDEVSEKIRELSNEARAAGFRRKPDVIAHSFGTWLLGHALQKDSKLKVGRVILTGSILRPDFDWGTLLESEQVEAVINHRGTRDFWARIAHYVIPDTGPSGRYGFNGTQVLDRPQADFEHSEFFKEALPVVFDQIWEPFLQRPKSDLASLGTTSQRGEWRPAPWPFQASLASWAVLVVLVLLLLVGISALFLGLMELPGVLRAWTS